MAYQINTLEDLKVIAAMDNCELYKGADDELLLDLDDVWAMEKYDKMMPLLRERFHATEKERWPSKGGKGVHVVVKMEYPLSPALRIALQACLGSDPTRELLAAYEFNESESDTISLFRPKAIA